MIAFHKGEIPFTLLLLPFLAGLGADIVWPCNTWFTPLAVLSGILLVAFLCLNLVYQKLNLHKAKWVGGVMVCILLFLGGMLAFENDRENNQSTHFSKNNSAYLIGHINSEPKLNAGTLRFIFKVESGGDTNKARPLTGNLMVSVKLDTAHKLVLAYGDRLIIPGKVNAVEGPLNPAEFNYKTYLAHQNIYQQAYLIQHQVNVVEHNTGDPLIANALKLRLALVTKLKSSIRDTDAVAVASTIILGYRADLRKEVQEAYAKTGTMHLLSVAGMHVGLVYLMISFLLSFLPHRKHTKLIKAIVSITLIWFYAVITGFSAPVDRAALMLTMVIIGFSFNRHINRLNVLAVSAFILLLYNPLYICDAGFQLSYLAVFGIIIIQPYVYKWLQPKGKIAREVWLVCSVSIAAQIILFPIGAMYFHDFPVYFLVSNVFIIIPSALVMYAGIAYLALPHIPFLSNGLAWLLEKTITIMTKTLSVMEHAPYGSIDKIWLNNIEFILLYAIIVSSFGFLVQRNKQWLKVSLLIGLLIVTSLSLKAYRAGNTAEITFFSMRKNEAILFRDGNSAALLTDLKVTDKAYQYSIQPYLDSCRVTQLCTLKSDTTLGSIRKSGNLIQFNNNKILIMNAAIAGKKFSPKLNVDYICVSGNPDIDLQYLTKNYNFKLLIADGTNSARRIDKLKEEAQKANVNFKDVKRNISLLLVPNP